MVLTHVVEKQIYANTNKYKFRVCHKAGYLNNAEKKAARITEPLKHS
jgi:hypothetical protein